MWPIQTQDKLFHDGNGTTELGTVVTAEWLNDVQQALLMVLAAGDQTPAKGKHNLLRDAIQRIVNNHTPAASATVAGVVKLNDTLSSQSTTEALTANQGRLLNGSKLGNSGNQTIDGILSIASKNWGRLVMPTNDGGRWIFEVNPSGAADPRVNFGFAKPDNGGSIYIGFPTITKTEEVAYKSWVSRSLDDKANLKTVDYGANPALGHNKSGFYRSNGAQLDSQVLPSLEIHAAHSGYSNNSYARGIGFNYGPDFGVWTTAWSSSGVYQGRKIILTEDNGVMLTNDQTIAGTKTFAARPGFMNTLQVSTSRADYDAGRRATIGANSLDAWFKNETSGKYLALKNDGELHYGGHKVYTAEYKPSWTNDFTNKPTTVAASGLTDAATKTEVSNAATAVKNEILGGAGAAFDTLKELAAALGNDANFANTITSELANKADKATTLAGYGLGNAIAVLTGTIADGGTIPLPAGFSEAQCKFMVSTARDNPEDVPWDIDESGRHVHYGYECTLNGRVVSCKVWLNKKRTTMGNAHPEIIVPGRANYLVIAYK